MDRVTKGERMDEKDYDNLIFKKCNEMVKEYGISREPETPIPSDDHLADSLYEAALHLAIEVGGYCIDTGRVIKVTEDEINDSLRETPKEVTAGYGKESRKIVARKPEEETPLFFMGGTFAPYTEDVAPLIAKAMAMLPIDGMAGFNFRQIAGRRIADMPLETWANRREMEWAREGIVRAGKPGLHILNYPISPKAAAIIGVLNEGYIRKTDGVMISPLPELFKIDYETLTADIVAREYGCLIESNVISMAGGYAGGYEGSAIVGVAGSLLTNALLFPDSICLESGMHCLNPDLWAIPEMRWAHNLSIQALARNTLIKTRPSACTSSEPGTLQCLLEIAYSEVGLLTSGASAIFTSRPVRPNRLNLPTPLEVKWGLEIARGALGMSRKDANEFVRNIQVPREKLEVQLKGKGFTESFDLEKLTPNQEYSEIYKAAKKKLADLGFDFQD
jgi:methylamine--corrinoid protein Co-methyltransferase